VRLRNVHIWPLRPLKTEKKKLEKVLKKKVLIEHIQIWPLRPLKNKKEKLTNAVRCVYYTSARLHSACAIAATEKKKGTSQRPGGH